MKIVLSVDVYNAHGISDEKIQETIQSMVKSPIKYTRAMARAGGAECSKGATLISYGDSRKSVPIRRVDFEPQDWEKLRNQGLVRYVSTDVPADEVLAAAEEIEKEGDKNLADMLRWLTK